MLTVVHQNANLAIFSIVLHVRRIFVQGAKIPFFLIIKKKIVFNVLSIYRTVIPVRMKIFVNPVIKDFIYHRIR